MVRDHRKQGFSLVEVLVALLFVGILMAGMANIFRSSLGHIAASGEGISALRRNRVSVDLLYDDLNNAGLFLNDLSIAPRLSANNPVFYILPNMPIEGAAPGAPATGDQLFYFMDEPLPFEGRLQGSGNTASEIAELSAGELVANDSTTSVQGQMFCVNCQDNQAYANMVKEGYGAVFKDSYEVVHVSLLNAGAPANCVWFETTWGDTKALTTGVGAIDTAGKVKHLKNAPVLFFRPAQMVRYSIKMKAFDPKRPEGVPCLVRDQGNYDPTGFVADGSLEAIVAENVSGFKAYLSADAGQTWAGSGKTYTGFNAGWTTGIQAELNAQLGTSGRTGFRSITGLDNWIRSIPVLVRADITTRSATQRTEHWNQVAAPTTTPGAVHKEFTQSLVMVPRHFGLPMN